MGGVLVITVPLYTGGIYKIAEIFEMIGVTKWLTRLWQLHFHSPHIYYFSKSNMVEIMKKHGLNIETIEDVKDSINPKRMKERFEMDRDEKHGRLNAFIFRLAYPIICRLPADKAVFVFRNAGKTV